MCGCEANDEIRALLKKFRDADNEEITGRYVRYDITVCSGNTHEGRLLGVEEDYVVMEKRSDRGGTVTDYIRICCICSVTEFVGNYG